MIQGCRDFRHIVLSGETLLWIHELTSEWSRSSPVDSKQKETRNVYKWKAIKPNKGMLLLENNPWWCKNCWMMESCILSLFLEEWIGSVYSRICFLKEKKKKHVFYLWSSDKSANVQKNPQTNQIWRKLLIFFVK